MSVELIKEYVGAISPVLSSIVVVAGFYSTKKMLKSEVDVMLTKFEASTETKARESASKVVSDTQKELFATEKNMEAHLKECEQHRRTFENTVGEILVAVTALSNDIKEHSVALSMYDSYKAFTREIQHTIHHSVKVLGNQDAMMATKYLLGIYEHIKSMTKYIEDNNITGCDKLVFDAMTEQAIADSKLLALELGFDEDKINEYYSRKNMAVHQFKKEFFEMVSSAQIVNNVSRQYRTLTIRWVEKLCNEFIRHFFIER